MPLRRPAAFTLVEVTVAMALGAFVLMALLGMSMAALRTGRIATDDTFVGTIAQDVMTDLRVTSFDSLSGRSGQVVRCDRDGVLEGYAGYDGDPYYRLTIHIGDLPPTNYLKEVRLEVVWPVSVTPPPETNWYGTKIARKENL